MERTEIGEVSRAGRSGGRERCDRHGSERGRRRRDVREREDFSFIPHSSFAPSRIENRIGPVAADYITSLPKKESDLPEWQTAIEVLMLVARSGPTMMARIAVMKALNRHVERVFNPDRKDHHWGKRKLKRDQ
jgi:hypothetical protein